MKYEATSLEDIAVQFDSMGSTWGALDPWIRTQRANAFNAGELNAYRAAAEMIRNTTLTPDPIIAELATAVRDILPTITCMERHGIRYDPAQVDALVSALAKIEGRV